MSIFFLVLAGLAALATLATLGVGLVGMSRAGEFNARHGNRLMRMRILFQGLAVFFFILALVTG